MTTIRLRNTDEVVFAGSICTSSLLGIQMEMKN